MRGGRHARRPARGTVARSFGGPTLKAGVPPGIIDRAARAGSVAADEEATDDPRFSGGARVLARRGLAVRGLGCDPAAGDRRVRPGLLRTHEGGRRLQRRPAGTAAPAPAPRLRDPAFLPPTKAGGGFYAAPEPAETAAPQRPRPQQASARPR